MVGSLYLLVTLERTVFRLELTMLFLNHQNDWSKICVYGLLTYWAAKQNTFTPLILILLKISSSLKTNIHIVCIWNPNIHLAFIGSLKDVPRKKVKIQKGEGSNFNNCTPGKSSPPPSLSFEGKKVRWGIGGGGTLQKYIKNQAKISVVFYPSFSAFCFV